MHEKDFYLPHPCRKCHMVSLSTEGYGTVFQTTCMNCGNTGKICKSIKLCMKDWSARNKPRNNVRYRRASDPL